MGEEQSYNVEEMRGRLEGVQQRMDAACQRAGRKPADITLVWVSKFHPYAAVESALALGARVFGENRVQEAAEKFTNRSAEIQCHIIGPVQSNKLKKAALVADCIHSISSMEAVEKLEKVCAAENKTLDILFQVNAGEEETKSGLDIAEAEIFLEGLTKHAPCPHLRFRGLMTIGKNTGVPEDSRICFAFLRELRDKFLARSKELPAYEMFREFTELSMGMTDDMEVAIEEGATMIRIGTALFGHRVYNNIV
mgnify:FL=1